MLYKLRNLPCNIVPSHKLWCITGHSTTGGSGVLEWCYDKADAESVLAEMRKDAQYKGLRAEKYRSSSASIGGTRCVKQR